MAEVELQQIGIYTITELLRVSSTSTYYKGHDKRRKKLCIIKRLNTPFSSLEEKETFLLRGKQLKKLANRNISHVSEIGFDHEHGYLAVEYIPGETLQQVLPEGTLLAPDEVKKRLSPLAAALQYAHTNNVLHGNLHPGIILVGPQNEPILTEFALTRTDYDDEAIAYSAPEQLRGEPDAASDQYALASMAYQWLCGKRPYQSTKRAALLAEQEHALIPPPRSLTPSISAAVEQVILKALALHPEERFSHIMQFSDHYLSALMGFAVNTSEQPRLTISSPQPRPTKQDLPLSTQEEQPKKPARSRKRAIPDTPLLAEQEEPIRELVLVFPPTKSPNREEATPVPVMDSEPVVQKIAEEAGSYSTERPYAGPILKKQLRLPGVNDPVLQAMIANDLCQGGVLSQKLPGYEERPAQVEMASVVAQAISQKVPALLEASTGTGKSLAYLVPVVRSGKVAIVSTANKALQEQLFYKDIPFIQKHIKEFPAALVKGFGNYICLDRLETEKFGMQFYSKSKDFQRLYDFVNDPESDFVGDFETLSFPIPSDIRGRVMADSDQCAWSKCGFYGDCYVRQMRENANLAQVIVVNHTLLLIDAAMGGFLLPERDVIILDEAHHLEEEATRSFTTTINSHQVTSLLAQQMLKKHSLLSLQDEVIQSASTLWSRLELIATPAFKGRWNLESPLEEELHLATAVSKLADSLRGQKPKDLPEKDEQIFDKLLKRAQNLADGVRTVFSVDNPNKFVYYIERSEGPRQNSALQASAAPLDVTSWLQEKLFDKCNVICTSATLATSGAATAQKPGEKSSNFSYFKKRVGLEDRPELLERVLPLTFDYESHSLLYTPRHLPEPTFGAGAEEYTLALAREMYKLVKYSQGRAFLLFSSKRVLDQAYELMEPHLPYQLLKQGDMSRIELTKQFRRESSVLFGLKSFWEGVDIAGEALSLVVIDKLPFDPPDDPVHEARVAHMKAAGENWFGTYVLPQAILRLKQGIGRLLRTHDDRGVMAILDTRLHTKSYGKTVLNALPPARRTSNIRDVERFFAEEADV